MRWSLRTILLATTAVAILLFIWLNTTYEFHNDLSYWPPDIPPELAGQEIQLFFPNGGLDVFEPKPNSKIIAVDLTDLSNAKITIRLSPWQKWQLVNSKPHEVGWWCPYFIRGGSVKDIQTKKDL